MRIAPPAVNHRCVAASYYYYATSPSFVKLFQVRQCLPKVIRRVDFL